MGQVLYPGTFPFSCDAPFLPQYFIFNSNLSQAMKMYWRVKTWRVSVTLSDRTVGPPANGTYVSYCYWDVESEEELVCPNLQFLCPNPGWEEFSFFLFQNTDGNSIAASFLFRPTGDGGETSIFSEIYSNNEGDKPGGTLSIENFGEGGSCTIYVPNVTLPEYGNLSINIRANEYWSYGGTYNTETGEPL